LRTASAPPRPPAPATCRSTRGAATPVWLELVLLALDLVVWAQTLLLDGDLAGAEPKTLRYRLWHVAGKLTRHARRTILRLQRTWPWAAELARAFTRLRALPLRC
jgi:DDE family transposase